MSKIDIAIGVLVVGLALAWVTCNVHGQSLGAFGGLGRGGIGGGGSGGGGGGGCAGVIDLSTGCPQPMIGVL